MKILGINASPRNDGNVLIALETALKEAADGGAETKIVSTNKLNIRPCQGDNYCKEHDAQCALQDDMQAIYDDIKEADSIVIGTPIYFSDFTAQAKIIMDRMYAFFMSEKYQKKFGNKTVSFITSNGVAPAESFKPSLDLQMGNFVMLGFNQGEILSLSDNNVPGAIKEKDDQLAQVKEFGKNLLN